MKGSGVLGLRMDTLRYKGTSLVSLKSWLLLGVRPDTNSWWLLGRTLEENGPLPQDLAKGGGIG